MTMTAEQINTQARAKAQASMEGIAVKPTGQVEYRSRGRVAVIGGPEALEVATRLQGTHQTTIVLLHGAEEPSTTIIPLADRSLAIEGYLGNFNLTFGEAGRPNHETLNVDLILDLSKTPLLSVPLPPPGYVHASMDETKLLQAQSQLTALIGSFSKPRYFDYDASICAHGRAGQAGCNKCIEACPTEAITSLAEAIEVNPYLCQGGGACASVCPSGAIRYSYPTPGNMLERIRNLLQVYRQHDGQQPVIAFVAETDVESLPPIPSNLLTVIVEEVASVGLEIWLACLAYGAQRVLLFDSGKLATRVNDGLQAQLATAAEILRGLGYAEEAVSLRNRADFPSACTVLMPTFQPATFAGLNDKRRVAFMAVDHLFAHSSAPQNIVPLSTGAAFGSLQVDSQACTLCMSCTSVCPTHAVFAGNESPRLVFNEPQCVQCGICAAACPEQAISLKPRLLADAGLRQRHITLHEEAALCCISCGKPFATQSVVTNMLARLEGHWMFQNERAKRRLMMCEDCRVVDIVQDPDAMQQGFTAPRRQ